MEKQDLKQITETIRQSLQGERKIHGYDGLSQFLDCTKPTARKLIETSDIPRYQTGRKVFFYESDILTALKKT
jgi:excisionase family DNA binding protein